MMERITLIIEEALLKNHASVEQPLAYFRLEKKRQNIVLKHVNTNIPFQYLKPIPIRNTS